jgi:2-methylcitrate dehydratase PrpD
MIAAAAAPSLSPLYANAEPSSTPISTTGKEIMEKLSTYMGDAGDHPLPPHVEEVTKEHILDTIAAMISGVHLLPAQVALRFAHAYGGEKIATVVGSEMKIGPIEAALANGMMAHSDETDDSHAPSQSHPGCGIVPAALAAAETYHISGARFVRAVALGYDIGTRVSMTLGGLAYQYKTSRDTHQITCNFGAAAACGCAASLSAQQMRWVLDYASQQAAGISAWNRDTQHVEKSLAFAGFAARNGVTAAMLIKLGGTGVNNIFFGANNFYDAFDPTANREGLIKGLGVEYQVLNTQIKKWSVGSPMQASLQALEMIQKAHPFTPSELKSLTIRIDPDEAHIVNNRTMPDICMQYIMAIMVIDRKVTFQSSHDTARMKNPEVMAVRSKIQLIPDEALQKLYPDRVAIVDVTLKNGKTYTQRVSAVLGSPQNPMTHAQVAGKARDLMTPVLGATQTNKLIDAVYNVEKLQDITALSPLLQNKMSSTTA